jgi:hypothetical protein
MGKKNRKHQARLVTDAIPEPPAKIVATPAPAPVMEMAPTAEILEATEAKKPGEPNPYRAEIVTVPALKCPHCGSYRSRFRYSEVFERGRFVYRDCSACRRRFRVQEGA